MKISDLTTNDIANYLHLDEISADDTSMLELMQNAAVSFVLSYTGLTAEQADTHEDMTTVVLVLIQDMYDTRSLYVDKSNLNKLVEWTLGMHSVNLL